MSVCRKFVILFVTLIGTNAGSIPSNKIGINNIIDIPNKLGFGAKGNDSSGSGTITVMGIPMIPNIPSQIFGVNKTGTFGSMLTDIPNKVFGSQNKTGSESGPDFASIISGFPNAVPGNNKTSSENGTNSSSNGLPDFGSIISEIPNKVFGNNNKSSSENETSSGSGNCASTGNGWPGVGSIIPGILGNKPCGGKGGISNNGHGSHSARGIPGLGKFTPENGANSSNIGSIISEFSDKVVGKEQKSRKKRCKHSSHHGHGEEHTKSIAASRPKRQSLLGSLGSVGSSLGSGESSLGSLGSSLGSGNATLVMGMFQVLVKPIEGLPGADGLTEIIKNPQSILTQPQTWLNGGK